MKELKRRYPEANIYFLLFKQIEETIDLVDIVPKDNVFVLDNTSPFFVKRYREIYVAMSAKKDRYRNQSANVRQI